MIPPYGPAAAEAVKGGDEVDEDAKRRARALEERWMVIVEELLLLLLLLLIFPLLRPTIERDADETQARIERIRSRKDRNGRQAKEGS